MGLHSNSGVFQTLCRSMILPPASFQHKKTSLGFTGGNLLLCEEPLLMEILLRIIISVLMIWLDYMHSTRCNMVNSFQVPFQENLCTLGHVFL